MVAAGCVGCKASGTASPHSRVPGKPARGSRAVACGFGREMRRDRVQAGPGRGWPRAPMAQPQSFGSEWRLSEGGGGGDRLFWRQPRLRDFGGSGGVNSLFCSCAGGGGRDRCSVPAAGWAPPVSRRVSARPSRRGLVPDPNPNPNPNPQQKKASTTGEEMSLRCPLGCPAVPASRSLVILLSHFHHVGPLLCRWYVCHGRVLPLGRCVVLHLLFLDPRRLVSVGLGQGCVTAEPRAGSGCLGLRGPLAADLGPASGWGDVPEAASD